MSKKKPQKEITIRSSAAEYLTFITATGDGATAARSAYLFLEENNVAQK